MPGMPGRPPERNRNVFFLGAGFSKAAGLLNTAELLTAAHDESEALGKRLQDAYEYFYPEKRESGFRPDVVDFFSVLKTFEDIGSGLPAGFRDSKKLHDDLKITITKILCGKTSEIDEDELRDKIGTHPDIASMIQAGNVIITSNWDTIIERLCQIRGIPARLCGRPDDGHLLLLKLHGSIDWVLGDDAKKKPVNVNNYACLTERLFPAPSLGRRPQPSGAKDEVLRVRFPADRPRWQTIKGASRVPLMITMAPGKAPSLEPLRDIWKDAYQAISAARRLLIMGYSMPADDAEIRTLLRAGIKRGNVPRKIIIRNPAPDVHVRAKQLLIGTLESEYQPINAIG